MRSLPFVVLGLIAAWVPGAAHADPIHVDDFESIAAWSAHPAEGVTLGLASDAGVHGKALRLDVNFTHDTGYAVARREVSLDLPPDYVFRFSLRGTVPVNHLEFKLVDSTGQNVWWNVYRDLEYPRTWKTISERKRQIRFAWGPAGGGEIHHVAAIEIAITAGEGGKGAVWLDDLTLEPIAADSTMPPVRARASSGVAARAVDGNPRTAWTPGASDRLPWLDLDLGRTREFGGLDLRWAPGRHLSDYVIETTLDGATWTPADTVRGGDGGRDALYLPESEARRIRVRALAAAKTAVALNEATIEPLDWSTTPEAYFTNLAREAPRGTYPRPYVGEQCAWAVVGPDAASEEALLSEDGMVETGKGQWSIEPFLRVDGKLVTWADAQTIQSVSFVRLRGRHPLPSPTVAWTFEPGMDLAVETATRGDSAEPTITVQYTVRNLSSRERSVTLYLAVRPFQVNPPWQNIGFRGGTARVTSIVRDGDLVRVNGRLGLLCVPAPSGFGGVSSAPGDLVEGLRAGRLPKADHVDDSSGRASAALVFDFRMPPRSTRQVRALVPLRGISDSTLRANLQAIERTGMYPPGTRNRLAVTPPLAGIFLPPGHEVAETVDAQVGWILVNRDSGALQPGSRNYDRSWIRDGSLTSSALLRLGYPEVVRDFIEWFAPMQYENGKIPCCASDRGPDPVTENDSHGEFIWMIAEYYRYTGDRALVERMWPHVAKAIAHMDSLRAERRTAEFRTGEKRKFYGLLTPSISHEGYPNPMHSYWDDAFAYRGYVDGAYLARVLGRSADQKRIAAARDTFARNFAASVAAAMAEKHIDYVPGCAELGDFDATSTTVALTPTAAADLLPDAAIRATFERYWTFFTDRRDGRIDWDGFTPYEMRTIGSFVRLGWRDRADSALTWFMSRRQPEGWRQWGEVNYKDPRAPKYIGDFPHTWVGSDFVRSVLDMMAYERGRDSSLVLAAGVPWRRLENGDAVRVRDLGTIYGRLTYTLAGRAELVQLMIEDGLRVPPGGIVVLPPTPRPFRSATVNGAPSRITAEGGVVVRAVPARVELRP